MSVKKNFFFNSILLLSQYIFPLFTFPYISRILGVESIGLLNFADSIVNYFILFSTMGLSLTGMREVAKYKNNKPQLSKVFSELFLTHLMSTIIFIVFYFILVFSVSQFRDHKLLFCIGASKLLFNVFLVEWFYRGMENFKFITIRSIIIKIIFTGSIFILVKHKEDYLLYFILSSIMVIINAIVNFSFIKGTVNFVIKDLEIRKHLKPFFTIGSYAILTNMYTSFNIAFLGMTAGNTSVGYYSTAIKLYSVILGFFSALNTVLMPRLTSLASEHNETEFNQLIRKSVEFVSSFSFPIIACCMVLAHKIIELLSGKGFEGAIVCFRIIIPLVFVVGIAQILANQILMSIKRDKELLIASAIGGILGGGLNFLLVPKFHEIGTSLVLFISESVVTLVLLYYSLKYSKVNIPVKPILQNITCSIPYTIACYIISSLNYNTILTLGLCICFSLVYFGISQIILLKNIQITNLLKKIFNTSIFLILPIKSLARRENIF